MIGMLPELCVGVPGCHVEQQVKDCFVVRGKEEAIEYRDATLGEERSEEEKCSVPCSKPGVYLQSVLPTSFS